MVWSAKPAVTRYMRAAHGASPIMLIARSELPPLPIPGAIPRIGLLVVAIAVERLIRVSISGRRLVCPVSVSIVTVVPVPIRTPMYPAINARNASWSERTTNHG